MPTLNALAQWNEWRKQPVVLYGIHHAAIFMTIFIVLGHLFYHGPGELERHIAGQIIAGKVPYIDFSAEYPPLAFVAFILPALVFKTQPAYSFGFAFELLTADIVILAIIASLARRLKLSVWSTLFVYTLFILAVGPLVITRYDLFPTMLTLAGIYAFVSNRSHSAWALIALGTAAKLYPVLVAPLFVLYHLREKQYGRLIGGGAIFLAVTLVAISPWLVINAKSLLTLINYHAERGLHADSTYGTVLLVIETLKGKLVQGSLTFGSWNIVSPVADRLAAYSTYVTAGALLAVYALYGWRLWRTSGSSARADSINHQLVQLTIISSALAVTVFMLGGKVFSPQYLIWLCPLLPLATGEWRTSILTLFLVAAALSQYIFPYHYIEFEMFKPHMVLIALARNLLMVVVLVLLVLSPGARGKRRAGAA